MNVEIGAEAALFPEKEYISGIFVAVYLALSPAPALLPPSCFEDVKTTRLLQLQDGAGDGNTERRAWNRGNKNMEQRSQHMEQRSQDMETGFLGHAGISWNAYKT